MQLLSTFPLSLQSFLLGTKCWLLKEASQLFQMMERTIRSCLTTLSLSTDGTSATTAELTSGRRVRSSASGTCCDHQSPRAFAEHFISVLCTAPEHYSEARTPRCRVSKGTQPQPCHFPVVSAVAINLSGSVSTFLCSRITVANAYSHR